jgi:uncharacterized damage-inducible protein DinB
MTPMEREFLLKQLAETRDRLLNTARGLSPEQLLYRPEPGRWSVAENVEHITFVEKRVLGRVDGALQQPPGSSQRSTWDGQDEAFIKRVEGREDRVQAPEAIVPIGRWPLAELLPEFEATRKQAYEFATSTNADLRRHILPHPLFGDVDCYQWLLFVGAHCDRHRAQSEEVKAAPGFPRVGQKGAPA